MESSSIFSFFFACIILSITPGPDMIYCLTNTLSLGKREGFYAAIGSSLGLFTQAFAATLGISQLVSSSPELFFLINLIGGIYLLYLSIVFLKMKSWDLKLKNNLKLYEDKMIKKAALGYFLNITNPKATIFFLSFFPQFINKEEDYIFQGLFLSVTLVSLAFLGLLVVCNFGSKIISFVENEPRIFLIQKYSVFLLFLYFSMNSFYFSISTIIF